jgi:hypothetical protein
MEQAVYLVDEQERAWKVKFRRYRDGRGCDNRLLCFGWAAFVGANGVAAGECRGATIWLL